MDKEGETIANQKMRFKKPIPPCSESCGDRNFHVMVEGR